MGIYDPIALALGLAPMHFEFIPPKSSESIPSWNKGFNQFGTKENHPWYGKKHTDETKAKVSATKTGKPASEETRKKMSEARKGKPAPCSMLGRKHSPETREKMRVAALNRKK